MVRQEGPQASQKFIEDRSRRPGESIGFSPLESALDGRGLGQMLGGEVQGPREARDQPPSFDV